jgi:hypothetical protein
VHIELLIKISVGQPHLMWVRKGLREEKKLGQESGLKALGNSRKESDQGDWVSSHWGIRVAS